MKGYRTCVECGESFSLELRNGMSKYCGSHCIKVVKSRTQQSNREKRKIKALLSSEYNSKLVFDRYRLRSPTRGLVFELTLKDFIDAANKPCYYCGEEYESIGFDRIDSNLGYTLSNSVPCCPMCNMMKRKYSVNDFINKCKSIAHNH